MSPKHTLKMHIHTAQDVIRGKTMLYLPDTMHDWPWPRAINPHFELVKKDSDAWFRSFNAFTTDSQYAFEKGDFARLAALAYPWVSKECLRCACDFMVLFFLIDEYTDVEPKHVVREMLDVVVDALHNPHKPRPEGEILLGEVARQFWASCVQIASPSSQLHLIKRFTSYLEAVIEQAGDRDDDNQRTVSSYFEIRQLTIGAEAAFALTLFDLDITDEVLYNPVIMELSRCSTTMMFLDNDMMSYNKEQAVGDDQHNILTVVMRELNTDLGGAINLVVNDHIEVKGKFLEALKRVPSWGPVMDRQVQRYLNGVANWPRANDCWNFESGRYFGNKGLEYQETRSVPLLPRIPPLRHNPALRQQNVAIPLVEVLEAMA